MLAVNTTYLVGLSITAGPTLTPYFGTALSHGPSATAGNVGVEIVTGLDAVSIIGMIRTDGNGFFIDQANARFVISWFNQRPLPLQGNASNIATNATFPIDLGSTYYVQFVTWGPSVAAQLSGTQVVSSSANNAGSYYAIGVDSGAGGSIGNGSNTLSLPNVGYTMSASARQSLQTVIISLLKWRERLTALRLLSTAISQGRCGADNGQTTRTNVRR